MYHLYFDYLSSNMSTVKSNNLSFDIYYLICDHVDQAKNHQHDQNIIINLIKFIHINLIKSFLQPV